MKFRQVYIRNTYSLVLFLAQYILILVQLVMGSVIPKTLLVSGILIVGLALGFRAIVTMGGGNINAAPDVLPSGRLVTAGPYKVIRHPMYAAVIMVLSALLVNEFGFLRLSLFSLLVMVLIFKMAYEEGQLKKHYPDYPSYMTKTSRIIPYIF